MSRFGIGEWFGEAFFSMQPHRRQQLAALATGEGEPLPCPFQPNRPPCRKAGGVCSLQQYDEGEDGRIGDLLSSPVSVCPKRFEEEHLVIRWLAEIVGFPVDETMQAREIPFMESISTDKPAGKIDLVIGRNADNQLRWYGLEIQAVYFSGPGMTSQFQILSADNDALPPYPNAVRRPDWRSSSAKRLMPQLQIKAPTLRRWQTKMAVSVDRRFYDQLGGPSPNPSRDLNDGDIIWLVPELILNEQDGGYHLRRSHWEVLTLEASNDKLLAARTISRGDFEQALITKLVPLE